jgi:tRNA-modifying protein YgfZ
LLRTSAQTLVLSPKGHIEHDLHRVDDGQRTWITVEPGTTAALASWLDSLRFMLAVQVRNVSADYAVIGEPVRSETTPVEPWPGVTRGRC